MFCLNCLSEYESYVRVISLACWKLVKGRIIGVCEGGFTEKYGLKWSLFIHLKYAEIAVSGHLGGLKYQKFSGALPLNPVGGLTASSKPQLFCSLASLGRPTPCCPRSRVSGKGFWYWRMALLWATYAGHFIDYYTNHLTHAVIRIYLSVYGKNNNNTVVTRIVRTSVVREVKWT